MTATYSDEWIQESIARLDALEAQREGLERALEETDDPELLRQHQSALTPLEAEISDLYTALEAAANADSGDDETANAPGTETASAAVEPPAEPAPAPIQAAAPVRAALVQAAVQAAPVRAAQAAPSSPFGNAPPPAANPFSPPPQSPTSAPPMSAPMTAAPTSYDPVIDDYKPRSPIVPLLLALLLAGGGAGGYYFYQQQQKAEPAAEKPAGPPKVISAMPVPPDTQGPKAAKGADVDSSSGTMIRERARSGGGSSATRSGGGSNSSRRAGKKPGKHEIVNTDDPLAGIND